MLRFCAAAVAAFCFSMHGLPAAAAEAPVSGDALPSEVLAQIDQGFANFAQDAHIPGLVYGVVANGRLVHVRGFGVQDLESKRPVTADSLFRIASMTKAFTALTILKLRDDGRLRLDEPAETYVPELKNWKYPTADSPRIRVRDLLNHSAGFVTDDPWGDRQTPMPEAEFSRLLREGVPFTRAPELAMEYSNLGYALLGRIITNVSGRPYADTVTSTLLQPLGMASTGFFAEAAPKERRAQGYRWQDDQWTLEPTMAHGAFGAMGGVQTSANDYARWIAFLLSAWPARDEADTGPVRRATVREMAQGSNFPALIAPRQVPAGQEACRRASTYGMGLGVTVDCELGRQLSHGGGYPGYGSFMLLLPQNGVGIFAFANRTYAGPAKPVFDAASALKKAGFLKEQPLPVSLALATAYRAAGTIYEKGDVTAGGNLLAMNFLLDRDAAGWARDLASLKKQLGDCDTSAPVTATGALAGEFNWNCTLGRASGSILLAPTQPPRIQTLRITRRAP
jgi:CubicO group peptidase (beta-lactamase class C family)